MMVETYSFGYWVSRRRKSLDLTREDLARRVGCAAETIKKIERDERRPSHQIARLLANALAIPPEEQPLFLQVARGERSSDRLNLESTLAAPSPTREQITNLPAPVSSFIGREKDVALIQQRLAEHRLITLIGVGGIGKTRLSQEVASRLLGEYANGVWLIELASLNDPTLVPQAVGAVFGIRQGTDRTLVESLIHVLHAKTALLLLDNCEHLLDACAELVDELLKNCPNLKILVTSREALGIIGEALYQVQSLTIPEIQTIGSFKKLMNYESILLFTERAQLFQMDFELTKENASSIAQICSRLDGIPLAIELAAVHIRTLSEQQIAEQLNKCFHLLTSGSRSALPRHQTLQACIDWSWHLLHAPEQTVMRRLSVFAGGFTLDAAGQICAGAGIESREIANVLSRLVMKSLIVAKQDSGQAMRYHFHEIVRLYAHERLVEAGEEENFRTQHLKYFLELSEQIEAGLRGPQQMEWFARMTDERNNLRAALEQASKTDIEAGLYLSGRLQALWESFDLREGARWLTEFIQKAESKDYPRARAKALLAQAWFLLWFQHFARADATGQESLELFRACADRQGEVDALLLLSHAWVDEDGPTEALEYHQQALTLARSLGDKWRQAKVLTLPVMYPGSGRHDHQHTWAAGEEALALFREVGDWHEITDLLGLMSWFRVLHGDIDLAQKYLEEATRLEALSNKSIIWENAKTAKSLIALLRGDYAQARSVLEEIVTRAEEKGNRFEYLWARVRLGYVTLREGNLKEARRFFTESARDFQKDENPSGIVFSLEGMAGLYVEMKKYEDAARLIGWADAMRTALNDARPPLEQADVDKIITACLVKIGEIAFADAYDRGKTITIEEAVAYTVREVEG
jgi:predicted ATPase/DNA-binding XRE family transcriptional regulator